MIRRNTWVLLGVFVILLAGAIYLQRSGGLKPAAGTETPTPAEKPLLDIQAEAIRTLKIENAQGQVVTVERQADGTTWKIVQPQTEAADANKIEPAISSLVGLGALNPLETTVDLKVIGLESPADTITIGLSDGGQHVLLIGTETPITTGYYARLDGGAPLVISKFSVDSVLGLLQNPPTLATSTTVPGTETPGSTQAPAVQGTGQPSTTETATNSP